MTKVVDELVHNAEAFEHTSHCADKEDDDELSEDHHHHHQGNASMSQTIINMAKTCMGTGCLVLPFAAKQGGLVLHTIGLFAIAAWNVYTVQRLCACVDYIPKQQKHHQFKEKETATTTAAPDETTSLLNSNPTTNDDEEGMNTTRTEDTTKDSFSNNNQQQQFQPLPQQHPPEGTAMFGQVIWYALGGTGLIVLDIFMLLFLMGVLVTYVNAMRSFLRDTPLTTGSTGMDCCILIAIMGPLSIVPHMGYLAAASGVGLLVLAWTFCVVAGYGIMGHINHQDTADESASTFSSFNLLPHHGLWGISHWFGCVVFSFGVAPLTYNYRSSMADPSQMVPATWLALMGVAVAYIAVAVLFLVLFPELDSDILQELPKTGNNILPILTRVSMVLVVLMTAPLLIVPCGELLEGKVHKHLVVYGRTILDLEVSAQWMRIVFRFGICFVAVGISLYVPGFVDVLSFVGCCCVAMVGFCIPPLIHAILYYQYHNNKSKYNHAQDQHHSKFKKKEPKMQPTTLLVDILMLTWGIFATVVSTTYTFRQLSVGGGDGGDASISNNSSSFDSST
jgi:amino acid permease